MSVPELDRLKSQLLTSGLQQKNNALYQVINQLIDFLRNMQIQIFGTSTSGGGSGLLTQTFLTKDNETPTLPASSQLFAGSGIQFNDVGSRRIISAALPLSIPEGFDESFLIPGPIGLQGIPGIPGPFLFPEDGIDGIDGFPGIPGRDGFNSLTIMELIGEYYDSLNYGFGPPSPDNPIFTVTTTGDIDDLDFGNAQLICMNNATLATIRGLKAGYDGQVVRIHSKGAGDVFLAHQNAGSSATNRLINCVTSGSTPMAAGRGSASFFYDLTSARWRMFNHNQGSWIAIAFNAGDFTGNGAMTWTVAAGDVAADSYFIQGRALFLAFRYQTTSVGGVVNTVLQKLIPNGYTFSAGWDAVVFGEDNAVRAVTWAFNISGTQVGFAILAGGNWTASANLTKIAGSLVLPIT